MFLVEKKRFIGRGLLLTAILASSASWTSWTSGTSWAHGAGGEGAGFNGPTLSPVSIPVRLDRGVTVEDVSHAVEVCLGKGDPRKGIKSVMQQLGEAIFPDQPELYAWVDAHALDSKWEQNHTEILKAVAGRKSDPWFTERSWTILVRERHDQSSHSDSKLPDLVLGFNRSGSPVHETYDTDFISNIRLQTQKPFPQPVWDSTEDDSDYDQWGEVAHRRTLVKGLRIERSPKDKGRIGFFNTDTKRPVALEINTEQYVQCLQSEIQAGASN